jgi:hypothetical protein
VYIGAGSSARVGLILGTVYDWLPDPGSVVCWQPSPASLEKVRQAPVSAVPLANMQAAHIRGFCDYAAQGLDYARLVIGCADVPGRCDVRVMNYVINAHLRRHSTYHSWFEYQDEDHIIRHTIGDSSDIEFAPVRLGQMTPNEWQRFVLSTPDPLQWDCFRFGIIQRADHFTFYAIVDHLHCDPTLIAGIYNEVAMNYQTVVAGGSPLQLPPVASHDDFCARESKHIATMTLDSPEVQKWIEFAELNGGTLPDFPLPVGDLSVPSGGDVLVERLMDPEQTFEFESLCASVGARFSGGLFACTALAQYELTGAETYYGLTPTDKRKSPAEFMAMGWFTGVVPFTVPVDPASFGATACAAQASFDSNMELANVSFNDVVKLAPWLRKWGSNCTMINYMDAGLPPFNATVTSKLEDSNVRVYCDPRDPAHFYFSVIRLFDEVSIVVNFPNNPIARESVNTYVEAMKSVFARVAEGRYEGAPVRASG